MSIFRTEINLSSSSGKIDYQSGVMMLGSCFTKNIGNRMSDLKMKTDVNPFGIIYNPSSLKNSLDILLEKRFLTAEDIFCNDGQWNSFAHHSRFSRGDKKQFLDEVNARIETSSEFLAKAEFLIFTFGTSWFYRYKKTGAVVSNCHKFPADEFTREFLEAEEIVLMYTGLLNRLQKLNPQLQVIFTVSPIRHWKDGAVDNMHSKASLIVAIHHILKKFQNTLYFPAYEIMMDDLRDYRFYNEDMLHPSAVAIDYIWNKFSGVYFSDETLTLQKQVDSILSAASHRPFNSDSEGYLSFCNSTIEKIKLLEKKYPFLDFEKEKKHFASFC